MVLMAKLPGVSFSICKMMNGSKKSISAAVRLCLAKLGPSSKYSWFIKLLFLLHSGFKSGVVADFILFYFKAKIYIFLTFMLSKFLEKQK